MMVKWKEKFSDSVEVGNGVRLAGKCPCTCPLQCVFRWFVGWA